MLQKVDTKRLTAGLIVLTFLVIAVGGLISEFQMLENPVRIGRLASVHGGSILAPRSKKDGGTKIPMK